MFNLTQTNLVIGFTDGQTMFVANVHPDNNYKIVDGLLTFETLSGDEIHYFPAINIRNFYTVEENKQ
jgi:hypothetical protein